MCYGWRHQCSFPGNSAGKESACSVGDPGSIPGSGRSIGEGISYELQYPWVSLVAQMVNNLPAVWETWVRSLGWEDALEESMATLPSSLAWRIPWVEGPGGPQPMVLQSDTAECLNTALHQRREVYETPELCSS